MNIAQLSYIGKVCRDAEADIDANHARNVQPLVDVVRRIESTLAYTCEQLTLDITSLELQTECRTLAQKLRKAKENLNSAYASHDNVVDTYEHNASQSILAVVNGEFGVGHP